ncbi:MAG: 3-hydroxybutyryl-CoA dehydrogenase [Chloroflexi bacterium]|nr:3-hydroxybutyryl-CoA dehydrogenase [Chloroflexota bacterium]
MDIKTVGVVGCGLMGSGIVELIAKHGYTVIVREINDDFLAKGLARVQGSLARAVEKNKLSAADRDATLARIKGTTQMADLANVDLAIEAAIENLDLKKSIFKDLDAITRPDVILASNTSSLAVTEMAGVTKRAPQVIGMHFFNPVPVMPLLELVRTFLTSDATLETVRAFGAGLGKKIVVAKDAPGFIVNALLVPYLLDAVRMYENGFATKEDIDTGIQLGLNHPMGPLTLLDFVGLDTTLFIADAVFADIKDARWSAPALLRRMVAAGYNGRKSGKGFYDYGK